MRPSFVKVGVVLLVAATCLGSAVARDGGGNDHEEARRAFERGELLPISEILEIATQNVPGDVVEVELKVERDRFIYEVNVLTATGQVFEVDLDGRTGTILEIDD